jgi:aspartyl-tRNA(Asn)/glutamyl-tRNA(Gln) amidotransferase subunit A
MHSLSAVEIRNRFVQGEVSATEIAKHFLERAQNIDPQVGAFLELFEAPMLEQADRLDAKRRGKEPLGCLSGVPIGIKDILNIRGHITTCGSKFLKNFVAPFDATAVRRIREEDGLLVGKTNLDEFAMGSSCEHSAYKTTRNPWDLKLVPGGSSGGSAAAVAAEMATITLGTDTGGSIRLPASFCGICGFKPTYGRVSRSGVVALASSFDQVGPFAYRCEDLELIMQVIGAHCQKDSTSLPDPDFTPISFAERFGKSFRVGVPWQFLEGLPNESRAIFDRSLSSMEALGGEIVEVDLSLLSSSIAVYYILMTAETSTNLARFDGIRYGVRSSQATTLDEVYDRSREEGFGDEVKRRILLGTFVLSSGYQEAYYKKAQKVRQLIINQFETAFQRCDVVAAPVSTGGAFAFGAKKDPLSMYLEDIYTVGANLAGLPALSVPAGHLNDGRPIGFQLMAPQRHDAEVLAVGRAFQAITNYHNERPTMKGGIL